MLIITCVAAVLLSEDDIVLYSIFSKSHKDNSQLIH